MRYGYLQPKFVEYIPEDLEPGILYISGKYRTAMHLCCCGCQEEVVTPLTENGWEMEYDGQTVSLTPSIGNYRLTCQSHYFIRKGQVVDA